MRQTEDQVEELIVKKRGRVTRGHSDLPIEESHEESEEQSNDEPDEDEVPKVKKIHHMTLKAMERKKKEAQLALLSGKPEVQAEVSSVKIPKKRGRPKGYTKKVVVEKEDFQVKQEVAIVADILAQKKQRNLRNRQNMKSFVEEDSIDLHAEEESQEAIVEEKKIQEQIEQPVVMAKITPPAKKRIFKKKIVQKAPIVENPVIVDLAPPAPKKRGRKKKVVDSSSTVVQSLTAKIYTVPKIQTYDNYLKHYAKIVEQSRQGHDFDVPLVFDKFSSPEVYKQLLKTIKDNNL